MLQLVHEGHQGVGKSKALLVNAYIGQESQKTTLNILSQSVQPVRVY